MGKNRASPGDGSLARKTEEVGGPGEGERQVRRRATGAIVPPLKNRLPAATVSTYDAHYITSIIWIRRMNPMKKSAHSLRKEASRERILEVGSRAVRRAGFHGVGIADVMKEAGLTHGGFYAHFASRDALLCAAVEHAAADSLVTMDAHAARLVAAGLSPFQAMVETYLYPGVIGDRERGCAMAALASEIPVQSDEVVEASREVARRLQRHVLRALPPGYPDDTAWSITGTMLGALQLARALGDNEEGRAVLAAAKRELLARYAPA